MKRITFIFSHQSLTKTSRLKIFFVKTQDKTAKDRKIKKQSDQNNPALT